MTFREKQALITLLAVWVVAIGYGAGVMRAAPADAIPDLIGAMILLIGIMIGSQIALVIGVGPKEAGRPSDERDRLVGLVSRRNAGWVGSVGLWAVFALALASAPPAAIAQAALAAFVLAEMVMYGSQLFYYRRGV